MGNVMYFGDICVFPPVREIAVLRRTTASHGVGQLSFAFQ